MKTWTTGAALAAALMTMAGAAQAQLLISGNDEKQTWDQAGKAVFMPPGKDTVSIIDISNRTKPRIVVNIPMPNRTNAPITKSPMATLLIFIAITPLPGCERPHSRCAQPP